MLYTLIRQEILTLMMSARFLAAVVITLLLVVANTIVLIDEHKNRVASYSQQEQVHHEKAIAAETYSQLELFVERPPNPLSLFSAGLDKRIGTTVEIYHGEVPTISSVSARNLENPYLNLFSQIDLVSIFQVVLSLLALLFAYDAIAGDWESGTLRLVISHRVRRGAILFGKYIAAMICLLLPVLMSLLMVMLQLSLASSIQLGTTDFLRIGGIVATTIIYLSVFYLIGLLISTMTRRTATSLMLCMFLWVALVLVYPNWSRFTLNPVGNMRAERQSANQQIDQIWEEADREEKRFLANSPLEGEPPRFNIGYSGSSSSAGRKYGFNMTKVNASSEPSLPHFQNYQAFIGATHIRAAEKAGLINEQRWARTAIRQATWDERLMKFSPASLYTFATSAWTGTDLNGMLDFIGTVQTYRQTLIDYLRDKDAFASRQWFASDQGAVDWWDLPRFRFAPADVSENAQRALADVSLLFLMNMVLFVVTFLIFVKVEV
ncbi:MAG: ABC transporter permease subunit [Candidatus Poribacteria bacterium]|nr:ABC transporter permease subunit [Candidatus Poribacteria bacterium]